MYNECAYDIVLGTLEEVKLSMTETSGKKWTFQMYSVCNAEHSMMWALRERRDFCVEMSVEVDLEAWIDF